VNISAVETEVASVPTVYAQLNEPALHENRGTGDAGIVFNIARYSTHDGPGIRTTVFFKGCPLDCWWCHNPEGQSPASQLLYRADRCIHCLSCVKACPQHAIVVVDDKPLVLRDLCQLSGDCVRVCQSGAREMVGKRMAVAEIMEEIEKDRVFYDESDGGATFSGGEPFMQPLFLKALVELCKKRGIRTAVETCGFVDTAPLLSTSTYVDQYLYDLKIMDDEKHRRFTRVSNKLILENLRQLAQTHGHITIRFPVIPGVNEDDENVSRLGEFISSLRNIGEVDVLPYHKMGIEKYKSLGMDYRMAELAPPLSEQVTQIVEKIRSYGLKVRVGG
jgi:pyruvate formate lyase activating enzyme